MFRFRKIRTDPHGFPKGPEGKGGSPRFGFRSQYSTECVCLHPIFHGQTVKFYPFIFYISVFAKLTAADLLTSDKGCTIILTETSVYERAVMTHDLTSGSPLRLILSFTVPLVLSNLFQQCFSLVDTVIVGRCIGVDALAAVGSTGSLNFLVIGLVTGCCAGMAIPIAQRFGAGDTENMRRYVYNAAYVCIVLAVLLTAVTALFTRTFLTWMRTPEDILDDACTYLVTIFYGIGGIFLYQMSAGVLRALGDSRTPALFLVLACLINAVLDLLLVIRLQMGVFGAALATVISQVLSGLACLARIRRTLHILRPESNERALSVRHIRTLLGSGIPMGLQYTLTATGSVVLQSAVNALGSAAVAAVTAAEKVSVFFYCVLESLGSSMATYVGQNLGARRFDRIRVGVLQSAGLGASYCLLAWCILHFAGGALIRLFVESSETAVIDLAAVWLSWNSAFFLFLMPIFLYRFSLQGLGYSALAMFAGVAEMIARILTAFLLVPALGFSGVCLSDPVAWLAADLFLLPAFYSRLRRREAQYTAGTF